MNSNRTPTDDLAATAVVSHFRREVAEAQLRWRAPKLAPRPMDGRVRSARWPGAALAVLVVCVVAVGLVFGGLARGGPGSSASASQSETQSPSPAMSASPAPIPSPNPSTSVTPSPTASPHFLSYGQVGFHGASGWMVGASTLSITRDGGRTWAEMALPSGVISSRVVAVETAPGRPVWLAMLEGAGVRLYRWAVGGAAWSAVYLDPAIPATEGPIQATTITAGPGRLVTVAATVGIGTSAADESLFVSTDDGAAFVRHLPTSGNAHTYWHSVTFVDAKSGVVAVGPGTSPGVALIHTTDGGTTWSDTRVSGLPSVGYYYLGMPAIVGSDIVVTATTWTQDGTDSSTYILVSHDRGATFAVSGAALPVGNDPGPVTTTLGGVTWVSASPSPSGTDSIFETSDAGKTWTSVTPTGLPVGGWEIFLTGPSSAVAMVVENGCAGFKTGCWSRSYLMGTTDGGRTWTNL